MTCILKIYDGEQNIRTLKENIIFLKAFPKDTIVPFFYKDKYSPVKLEWENCTGIYFSFCPQQNYHNLSKAKQCSHQDFKDGGVNKKDQFSPLAPVRLNNTLEQPT